MTLAHKLDIALTGRLYPNGKLGPKQLCWAVGISDDTLRRYRQGETRIPADVLMAMAAEFRKLGDDSFAAAVMGIASPDKLVWFSDTGTIHEATGGHAEFARRHLKMPVHAPGDMAAYAMRNLGWISGELRRDRLALVRYYDSSVDMKAASKVSTWLEQYRGSIDVVRRDVFVGNGWVNIGECRADVASSAICRAAEIARQPMRVPWRVERLSLETAKDLAPLIKAYREAPADIVETAAKMGKLSGCSLLRVSGTTVETVSVGGDVPCPYKGEFVGHNVFARADTAYAAMLHSHMMGSTEGETLHWLRGSIFARPVSYTRAAFYSGPETGLVLSVPHLRPSEEALSDARVCG